MPYEVLTIVNPEILQVLCLLRGVLKPTEQDYIVLCAQISWDQSMNQNRYTIPSERIFQRQGVPFYFRCTDLVRHYPMATPRRWCFAFSIEALPLPCGWIKSPEIIVMVESPLLWRRKLPYTM